MIVQVLEKRYINGVLLDGRVYSISREPSQNEVYHDTTYKSVYKYGCHCVNENNLFFLYYNLFD
jgi:hypothetical protein